VKNPKIDKTQKNDVFKTFNDFCVQITAPGKKKFFFCVQKQYPKKREAFISG
jgi:hypothetical protein